MRQITLGSLKQLVQSALGIVENVADRHTLSAKARRRQGYGQAVGRHSPPVQEDPGGIPGLRLALRRETVFGLLSAVETIDPSPAVLRRASQPLPTAVGTLDAIHLATALLWRDARGRDLTFATHDRRLASAARASGLKAIGV